MIKTCVNCGITYDVYSDPGCPLCLTKTKDNAVQSPNHYNTGKIEVIDAIDDWDLDFYTGNIVKYVARAGKKDANKLLEDLQKAKWYLNRKIKALEDMEKDK